MCLEGQHCPLNHTPANIRQSLIPSTSIRECFNRKLWAQIRLALRPGRKMLLGAPYQGNGYELEENLPSVHF